MKPYDIFISYRRTSYDTANLIATRLKAAGYSVFFDMETLRAGKFNEQLYDVIDNCKDFVLVLPPKALDRCVNEDDWVRLEVCRAMAAKKNIIPVMLNGFTWPDPMPDGMQELSYYHALTASAVEYFDLAMERLQQKYLISRRHLPVRKIMKISLILIATLAALAAITMGVFRVLSKDVCLKYATAITRDASYVHIIAEENHDLQRDWTEFNNQLPYESDKGRLEVLQTDMLARIDLAETNLKQSWQVDSVEMQISDYHSFLLSLHGINAEEIAISPQFATLYLTDYLGQLETMRNAVVQPTTINRRFVNALFEVFDHSINSYYASVLSELSAFPESSLVSYNEFYKHWTYFPKTYKVGESREYYEDIQNTEMKLAEEALARYTTALEQYDAELEDMQRKNDELENQINEGFTNIQDRMDATADAILQVQQNNHELAIRREKVNAKEQVLEATKDQLAELDKQYVATYEILKEKYALEEEDDQWYKWSKIRRWGTFLNMLKDSRESLRKDGIYTTSSVTPEIAYADMASMLNVYKTYHPESQPYADAAKYFFREVSKGERDYAGVIIFAFKDGASHPFFKIGDIVTSYGGQTVKSYDDFSKAYKTDPDGEVTYLRLENDHFAEYKTRIASTDIVGFLDLTE